jgi:hypothetical protein
VAAAQDYLLLNDYSSSETRGTGINIYRGVKVASFLSVFNVKKDKGIAKGPDTYLFTGGAVRCGYRVSLIPWET